MERKLFRLEGKPAMLGGVASGLAEYFNIDIAIVRVIFVLGLFSPIPFGIAYFILWLALPLKYAFANTNISNLNTNFNSNPIIDMSTNTTNGSQLAGIILVVLGGIFLADEFLPWFNVEKLWPLGLIAAGLWIFMRPKADSGLETNNDSSTNKVIEKSDITTESDLTNNKQ